VALSFSQQTFQGSFSSLLLCHLSALWEAVLNKPGEGNTSMGDEVLGKLKALLVEVVPHLLAKNGSKHQVFGATPT